MTGAVVVDHGVQVLLIGGRAGVGKTTVAYSVSAQLQERGVAHCHVEGDNLDAAYPKPADDPHGTRMTEANLAALWRNYSAMGFRRLIYVNTVSVLEPDLIVRAVGDVSGLVSVLLTGADKTVRQRLQVREHGHQLSAHVERSRRTATALDEQAPIHTHRLATDGRTPQRIAADIITLTRWG
jgi:predicted ATP-dependent serine protease